MFRMQQITLRFYAQLDTKYGILETFSVNILASTDES